MTDAHVVHIRRTIVLEYDVERSDYGDWTDDEVVACEGAMPSRDTWSLVNLDDHLVVSCDAEVTFR